MNPAALPHYLMIEVPEGEESSFDELAEWFVVYTTEACLELVSNEDEGDAAAHQWLSSLDPQNRDPEGWQLILTHLEDEHEAPERLLHLVFFLTMWSEDVIVIPHEFTAEEIISFTTYTA